MRHFVTSLALALAIFAAVSCGQSGKPVLPSVSGKAGEVVIVMDKSSWEGALGSAVRGLLAADCPYLAQREPLYSLVSIVPSNFTSLFQVHRNIVIFQIDPLSVTEGMTWRQDVWARPQCVIQIAAPDEERALEVFEENGQQILGIIEQAERDRVIANSHQYEEKSLAPVVRERFGGSPCFPIGYSLKKATQHFVWIADEKQFVNQGIFVYSYPARGDASDFELDNIIARRNAVMQEQVPGMFDNTYMTTAEFIPPTEEFVKYKGREFAQVRGFWEVHNDFMGGPFVSHSFYSRDGGSIVTLEAFVYAPKYDKRQYLRQVESILYSFQWDKDDDKGTGK